MKGSGLFAFSLLILAAALHGVAADELANRVCKGSCFVIRGSGERGAQETFDKFIAELGGEEADNGNKEGPINGGFRRIDWDAPQVPFDMPGNFFRDMVTRGILMKTFGDEFRVSNPAKDDAGFPDNLFDSINPQYPDEFEAFTPARIFSPESDNTFTMDFSIPGTMGKDKALVTGFGGIFVDVDDKDLTSMEFFDKDGKSIAFAYALPGSTSFLGINFKAPIVAKVEIKLGNAVLGLDDIPKKQDVVVMDDFLFGEPAAVKAGRKYDP